MLNILYAVKDTIYENVNNKENKNVSVKLIAKTENNIWNSVDMVHVNIIRSIGILLVIIKDSELEDIWEKIKT